MEIHRRSRPSSSNPNTHEDSNNNGNSKHNWGPLLARGKGAGHSPNKTATTDVILYRSIQLLLAIALAWLLCLFVSINEASEKGNISSEDVIQRHKKAGQVNSVRGPPPPHLAGETREELLRDISSARENISQLRSEFYHNYGGKEAALAVLRRGVRTFENELRPKNQEGSQISKGVRFTADRFLRAIVRHEVAASSSRPKFVMAFGGYSVTVGRGNHFTHSFPFVLQRTLAPVLAQPPLEIDLVVRNSAIGGIPSFPYGWCLSNFLGEDADAVSWDYAMNEGNGASGLESYVRQSLQLSSSRSSSPLFVLVDAKSRPRFNILQTYVNQGYLMDPIALGGKNAVDSKILELPEDQRPPGYRHWDEWGAPPGSPGQSPWHPKKKEHQLMGWMMAMHLLDAVDVALDTIETDPNWRAKFILEEQSKLSDEGMTRSETLLPPPVTDASDTGVASLLYGSPMDGNNNNNDDTQWHMHRISCRTSFQPNLSGHLQSIVESGVTNDERDMLEVREDASYEKGWVMDVGKVERETKIKVQKYGGLGYIDMKTALYGIPASGSLKLFLPYELTLPDDIVLAVGNDINNVKNVDESLMAASDYFQNIVICEVNEKRGDNECNMTSDISIHVGDAMISEDSILRVHGAASYLKKDICIRVQIPPDARMSARSLSRTEAESEAGSKWEFGLSLDVKVIGSHVTRENGACSISHVIWEHR